MQDVTRRGSMLLGGGALAAATLAGRTASAQVPVADVQPPKLDIEKGATLRVLRPTKFVDPDEVLFRQNTQAFTKATGVPVRVDFVGWEDLRPQTAVSARTGAGPDIVVGWPDDPHIYTDKLVDVSDIATYLGKKYGGWYFLADKLGKKWETDSWISIPMGGSGAPCVYRMSWVKEAGFDTVPNDLDQFLQLCRKLKQNGHPVGFALGNAVGDATAYTNWLLWSHGGYLVDEKGTVALGSKETLAALDYAKALQETFISGTLSWQDPSNNKAFIAGDIALTQNGVSVYYAAKNDPATAELAKDINHARMPMGPANKVAEPALILNAMIFRHSKYPNAAKEYMRFMMEQEQYLPWMSGSLGYWAPTLQAYAQAPLWKQDPKLAAYRDTCAAPYWNGYKGPISSASGAVSADYVVVHMFAAAASGQATPKDAMDEAVRRAQRYYKS